MNTIEFHDIDSPRTGKIARLPWDIRQALNERLINNEPCQGLVDWLNSLPETKAVLEQLFEGRPITQQNLSAWKLGGFREWQRLQQTRALAREFLQEADALAEEVQAADDPDEDDRGSILDRVGDRMALSLLQLFREAELEEKGGQRTRAMLDIAGQLTRLRRCDHNRQHAAIAQQRWEDECAQADQEEFEKQEAKTDAVVAKVRVNALLYRNEFIRGLATGDLRPRREKMIREHFAENAEIFCEVGIPDLPVGEDLEAQIQEIRDSLPPAVRKSIAAKTEKARRKIAAEQRKEKARATRLHKPAQGSTRQEIFPGGTGRTAHRRESDIEATPPAAGGEPTGGETTVTN